MHADISSQRYDSTKIKLQKLYENRNQLKSIENPIEEDLKNLADLEKKINRNITYLERSQAEFDTSLRHIGKAEDFLYNKKTVTQEEAKIAARGLGDNPDYPTRKTVRDYIALDQDNNDSSRRNDSNNLSNQLANAQEPEEDLYNATPPRSPINSSSDITNSQDLPESSSSHLRSEPTNENEKNQKKRERYEELDNESNKKPKLS